MHSLLQFFNFAHLPSGNIQNTSIMFFELANKLASVLPSNTESTTAMRKLLEAKDCAVRSVIMKHPDQAPKV